MMRKLCQSPHSNRCSGKGEDFTRSVRLPVLPDDSERAEPEPFFVRARRGDKYCNTY